MILSGIFYYCIYCIFTKGFIFCLQKIKAAHHPDDSIEQSAASARAGPNSILYEEMSGLLEEKQNNFEQNSRYSTLYCVAEVCLLRTASKICPLNLGACGCVHG